MNHPFWDKTITLYRNRDGGVDRRVISGCGLQTGQQAMSDALGRWEKKYFLLTVPGEILRPGDRFMEGIGPETDDWQSLHPGRMAGVFQIEKVTPYYIDGALSHTQAKG